MVHYSGEYADETFPASMYTMVKAVDHIRELGTFPGGRVPRNKLGPLWQVTKVPLTLSSQMILCSLKVKVSATQLELAAMWYSRCQALAPAGSWSLGPRLRKDTPNRDKRVAGTTIRDPTRVSRIMSNQTLGKQRLSGFERIRGKR